MTLRTVSPHASREVRPTDAIRRRISGDCSSGMKWNCTFWRVVRWPQPREYVSAMYAERVELLGRDAAVRDLDAQHLGVAALALAVDAVVQAEDAERVLVDAAVEVLGDGALEDVELLGDDRFEWAGREIADVDRHDGGSLTGRAGRTDGGGPEWPGPSAGAVATEFVAYFVRGAAHEDARRAHYPQNHARHLTPVPVKYQLQGREFLRPAESTMHRSEIRSSDGSPVQRSVPRLGFRISGPLVASAAMRMTSLFLRTLRDDPADAEVDSHQLLVRAGYIRRISAGIYSWLPLGYRVLRKVEQIVREEMDEAGAQEVLLPIVQPLELWERSGRDKAYGPLMFRLVDRKDTGYCLSPTAEEVVTSIVAQEYGSYRDLPVNLYQINWKYRDELRPRFGLLRGPRVPDEGRVLVRPRSRRPAGELPARCTTRTTACSNAAGSRSARSRPSRARWAARRAASSWPSPRSARTTSSGARAATTPRTSKRRGAARSTPATRRGAGDVPPMEEVHTPGRAGHRRCRRAPGRRAVGVVEVDRVRRRR